jgi:hypothetical protein
MGYSGDIQGNFFWDNINLFCKYVALKILYLIDFCISLKWDIRGIFPGYLWVI